jgi:nicotinamide-nucleotide adenylyltransferase
MFILFPNMLIGLLIGRFQPLHLGHIEAIKFAMRQLSTLIIVVGSAQISYELRNPFTAGERIKMIRNTLIHIDEIDIRNILIIPVPDTTIHALWTHNLDLLVPPYDIIFTNDPFTIALFQERQKKIIQPLLFERQKFSGTKIRENIVKKENWKNLVHFETVKVIEEINGIERLTLLWKKYKERIND